MKLALVSCLLAAFYSASPVSADDLVEVAAASPATTPVEVASSPTPMSVLVDATPNLELRQATVINPATTLLQPSQYPSVTTGWFPGSTGAAYVPITYTQTFVPTPDPLPSAGSGTIGYGTLTKHGKREAMMTGIAGRLRI